MLETLTIKDFAIIDHIHIDFKSGMTVLSGETGAGKSIIIDALGILCGGRGSIDFIRQGSDRLVVEGLFTFDLIPTKILSELMKFGIECQEDLTELIIRREITQQGRNVIRINGQLANVAILKTIGRELVDIHGQNEHQALLNQNEHLYMLDQFGGIKHQEKVSNYQKLYNTYRDIRERYLYAQTDDSNQQQRINFLEFQLNEIEEANLIPDEFEELETKSKRLQGAQQVMSTLNMLNGFFSENEVNILGLLDQSEMSLQEIIQYHPVYPDLMDKLTNLRYECEEISHQIARSVDDVDVEEEDIDKVEERLAELSRLKRKYGMEIDEIIAYEQKISEEIDEIQHREQFLKKLEEQLMQAYESALNYAKQLHHSRMQLAEGLVKAIKTELSELYMENSQFEVKFIRPQEDKHISIVGHEFIQLTNQGFDQAEFYVSTNVGESLKPLIKVASGGELSRFMLALKTVFGRQSLPKVMVFDEIDTGVSGRVAQAIAEKIKSNANRHQVLCITHLPQVAAISDDQLFIQKEVVENRTSTVIKNLSTKDRINVIAHMMSGEKTTKASIQLAQEMLSKYQKAIPRKDG